jgi:hypothetical protein
MAIRYRVMTRTALPPRRRRRYGGGDNGPAQPQDEQRNKNGKQSSSYDPDSAFHVVGNGTLTEEQMKRLTDREKSKLDQLVNRPASPY